MDAVREGPPASFGPVSSAARSSQRSARQPRHRHVGRRRGGVEQAWRTAGPAAGWTPPRTGRYRREHRPRAVASPARARTAQGRTGAASCVSSGSTVKPPASTFGGVASSSVKATWKSGLRLCRAAGPALRPAFRTAGSRGRRLPAPAREAAPAVGRTRIAGKIAPHHHHVDEEADQRLRLQPFAVGERGPDRHVVLPAMAGQEHLESRHQRREQRRPRAGSQLPQPVRDSPVTVKGTSAPLKLCRRGRGLSSAVPAPAARQPAAPVIQLARQPLVP